MKIEKEWSANSKPWKVGKGEELFNMAGRWGVGIEVNITRPYSYSQGPVEKMIISKETHDRESLSSPNTAYTHYSHALSFGTSLTSAHNVVYAGTVICHFLKRLF